MTAITISDEYTGDVSGGPARRRAGGADIVKLSVGEMDNNVYLITCTATGRQILIDAANDAPAILRLLESVPGTLDLILTTHRHPDHWQALAEVAQATGVPTAAGRLDAEALPVTPDRLIDDGDTITVGDLTFEAILLVGHTPGSIALALTDTDGRVHLITGDCLFPGGIGKTWSPEDFETLYRDVTTKLFDRYPDGAHVYPGHGKDTSLGAERGDLPVWRERGW